MTKLLSKTVSNKPPGPKKPGQVNAPLATADRLKEAIFDARQMGLKVFIIDATTFTHETLLVLLKLLSLEIDQSESVWIGYAPATEYAVGLPAERKWLSQGVKEIRSILGYPGFISPSRQIHLLVLVGFESDRAQTLIDAYEPAVVSLGVGLDSTDKEKQHLALNVTTLGRLAANYRKFETFRFSSTDYQRARIAIREQIARFPHYNIVMAPMNTKLSTIGAALCAIDDSRIQLCYALADLYNIEAYSRPGDECFFFELAEIRQEKPVSASTG